MDFAKFVALLKDRAIYFARADTLGDRFEGARGVAQRASEWKSYCLDYYRKAILIAPGPQRAIAPEELDREAERLYAQFESFGQSEIKGTYVSCWYGSTEKSEAQWRLYTPSGGSGVAIQTTFGCLDAALDPAFDIKAGYVQYVDFSTAFAGTYDRVFWKRASLRHECEVRAVIPYNPFGQISELGVRVPVDLGKAIQSVTLSPFSPPWLEDVVRTTMRAFGFDFSLRTSVLKDDPFF